jgi:D-serine deaminase-like pyridoxal phosphate-dependent protein
VHYYDGHLHEGDAAQRLRDTGACYDRLMLLLARLEREGRPVPEVTTSGTPTFLQALQYEPLSALEHTLHRVSPGTVVFHDGRSEEENEGLGLVPAALVFARVVSHPAADRVTADAGSKSVAAEAGDPCVSVLGHPELEALAPSEEHLPFRVPPGERPPRGTELLLVPRHVCPTVNLAEQALLIEDGAARGTVAVAARAHALGLA